MADPVLLARLSAAALTDEGTRKRTGWVIAAAFSPLILVLALLCSLAAGGSSGNASAVELCFNGGELPPDTPAEYAAAIEEMRSSFALLDEAVAAVNEQLEGGESLDALRVKAIFYVLYFGTEVHGDAQSFVDCFVSRVPQLVPVTDLEEIYRRTGVVTPEQQANAEAVYNLVRYGSAGGAGGSDVPFIGADGFCSPVGANWRNIVSSEFGYRKDPFTGQTKGHSGMDLAVPTGTSVRAALPGTVTISQYSSSYGYYVMIDHGGGLATLYAHNSKLLVSVGQTVNAGDVVSLSGSTGRSTGPHLHFEVRVNGERTDPRPYLP